MNERSENVALPSNEHATWLRAQCGHDSRTVEGCGHCAAADEMERQAREIRAMKKIFALHGLDTGITALRSSSETSDDDRAFAQRWRDLLVSINADRCRWPGLRNELLEWLRCKLADSRSEKAAPPEIGEPYAGDSLQRLIADMRETADVVRDKRSVYPWITQWIERLEGMTKGIETSDALDAARYRYLRERSPFDRLTARQKRWNGQEEAWFYATMVGDALDHEIDECTGATSEKATESRCECGIPEVWPDQFNPNCPRHKHLQAPPSSE